MEVPRIVLSQRNAIVLAVMNLVAFVFGLELGREREAGRLEKTWSEQ